MHHYIFMADIIPVILSFQYYSSMFNMKGTGDDVYSYCDIVRKGSIFNTKTLKCFNTLKTTIYIYIISVCYIYIISVCEIYLKKNISIAFLLTSRDYILIFVFPTLEMWPHLFILSSVINFEETKVGIFRLKVFKVKIMHYSVLYK